MSTRGRGWLAAAAVTVCAVLMWVWWTAEDVPAPDPVAPDPVALDPVALDPVALDPVAVATPAAPAAPPEAPAPRGVSAPTGAAALWAKVEAEIDASRSVPWNDRTPEEWLEAAATLHGWLELIDALPEAEREQQGPVVLGLLLELGRAAENSNARLWPAFARVGDKRVTLGHYRAAQLILDDPSLMEPDAVPALEVYVAQLTSGELADVAPDEIGR